jgi:hypothetical protein
VSAHEPHCGPTKNSFEHWLGPSRRG